MQIYDALKKDHRLFESLLDRLVVAVDSKSEEWQDVLDELSSELIPHAHAEEAVFYNSIREREGSTATILHSYAEHGVADVEVRALRAAKMARVDLPSVAKKLRDDLLHHISEEETRVFDVARKLFTDEEAEILGRSFEKLKPAYAGDADSMLESTKDLVANMLPGSLGKSFRKGESPLAHS